MRQIRMMNAAAQVNALHTVGHRRSQGWAGALTWLCAALLITATASAAPRNWTFSDQTVHAELVSVEDFNVRLRPVGGGEEIVTPLTSLSQADQAYVMERGDPTQPPRTPPWLAGYQVRYRLRVVGDPSTQAQKTVIASLPTCGWAGADAAHVAVQSSEGKVVPTTVLSHDPAGDTLVQFERDGDTLWYWCYVPGGAGGKRAKVPPLDVAAAQEGLTLEVRQWQGDQLADWASVRSGLEKSTQVIGNAAIAEIMHNTNIGRPGEPRNFAASYRGYLKIDKPGTYRFFANGHDACFFFIGEQLVDQRVGQNRPTAGRIPLRSVGSDIELAAGLHRVEFHQAVGASHGGSYAMGALLWLPPGSKEWAFVPRTAFVHAIYAGVTGIESTGDKQAASFAWGIDEVLMFEGNALYLVRFEAGGHLPQPQELRWDLGDGTTATGRSAWHVYVGDGDYEVSLTSRSDLPAQKRRVHLWAIAGNTSPFAIERVIQVLEGMDLKALPPARAAVLLRFLEISQAPSRWPIVERLTAGLLEHEGLDLDMRARLLALRMHALAHGGAAEQAFALQKSGLEDFKDQAHLRLQLDLAAARIARDPVRDLAEAGRRYQAILDTYSRLSSPMLRQAAIELGDTFVETGDLTQARHAYNLADEVAGAEGRSAHAEAITRGSMLRIAEQKLKEGSIRETRRLLDDIAARYPQQKLEALYRLLRAQTDRDAGLYQQAIQGYELLLNLPQAAGYRDEALWGIADALARDGQTAEAQRFLGMLREASPGFDPERIAALEKRLESAAAAVNGGGDAAAQASASYHIDFEPGRPLPQKEGAVHLPVMKSLGIDGEHVAFFEMLPETRYYDATWPLPQLESGGTYWLEYWYRDMLNSPSRVNNPHIHTWLYGPENEAGSRSLYTTHTNPTFGQWVKTGAMLEAPATERGKVVMSARINYGLMELDGLKVVPVSDRRKNLLLDFVEGITLP